MDNASSSTSGTQNPQKRVLPSRSRRGGPGVGTCEVDVLILETLKRRSENEPLIPANTSFILTTNSKYASDDPGGTITVNMVANDRYFDRPEVVKAFREQAIIQTPEFSSIGESSNVGGRFRPRAAEDDGAETSDTTYEKRHRKFETFEKRQRLREKEKLKHEHYKMKERLEQLRAMDSAAFMALPASSFSPISKEPAVDPEEIAAASSPYTNPNGYFTHAEGERRRKEMLEVATMLEERYRVLLPPDRVRRAPEQESASRSHVQSRDGDDSETDQASVIGEKLRLRLPARSSTSTTPAPSPAVIKSTIKKARLSTSSKQSSIIRVLRTTVSTPSPSPSPLPRAEASPLSPSPTVEMNISSPEPTPPPPSPIPTVAPVLPQTPISSPSMVESTRPDPLLSNHATRVSRTVSEQQNPTSLEQKRALQQELPVTPPDQDMLIIEQERLPALSNQESPTIPEPEKSPILNQERPKHDQTILPSPPEQESTLEPERQSASPKPENFNTRDQGRLQSPPVPNRLPTPVQREKSITPGHQRSLTPLLRDRVVTPEPEKLAPPLERERSVAPEREKTISPEPERLPIPSVPERPTTPLVDAVDEDLQDSLPEQEPSKRKSIEPRMADDRESEKVEDEDEMSVRAEPEVPAPQNEPEEEVDIELEGDKPNGTLPPIQTIVATGPAANLDATMDVIPDPIPTEQTILPDVPMQEPADLSPAVVKQATAPVHEVGPILDLPIAPEQRSRTESVDIEKMSSPMPISSISAPRSRARKKARLDSSVQPNETVSAPVRAPRIPKNHVTYIGASGEIEVTASAIIKAAVHRTQRDATRHLNAFGAPVPNVIIQMGPPFELPEWVFPPLSPAESEHARGDFDAIEDLELDPKAPLDRQVTSPVQAGPAAAIEADLKDSTEVNPDPIAVNSKGAATADYTAPIEVDPVEPISQPMGQPGPKINLPPPLPPPEPEAYEEDAVSLGDEDT